MHILDNMDYKYGIKNEVLNVDANYIEMCLPNWVLKIRKELTSIFVKLFHHFITMSGWLYIRLWYRNTTRTSNKFVGMNF